jgi:Flp pilus assembly protein TadG
MRRAASRRSQHGAVIVTVCLVLLFLLGFMGIALDFGRTFVVKSELQTAMDSCALAAAQELDGLPDAITRGTNAGMTAGNLNRVNFQSANWSGQGQITAAGIDFMTDAASGFAVTTNAAAARYARCRHTQNDVPMFLMHALGAFSGNGTTFPATRPVAAEAVATRASAQSTCPLPLALKPKPGGSSANSYGFVPGEWVTLLMSPGGGTGGQIGWANLDGSNSAAETEREMNGYCGVEVGDTLGTPGVQSSIADAWNERFGIYKNSGNPAVDTPDFTGYVYTATNWPSQFNAFNGPTPPGAHATAANFVTKRAAYASCADTRTNMNGPNGCRQITGLTLNGGFNKLATPGAGGEHNRWGASRRIALVPVVNTANGVIDYACMLMLQPMSIPPADVQLEFIGMASAAASPCTTSGLPGGTAGPLVPVLVR